MKTTIDQAGRVVIPKAIRDRVGLHGGEELTVQEREGWIALAPSPTPMRLERRGGGLVVVPSEELPVLTDEVVRATLERVRR